jgi:hypothetical protein
MANTVIALRSSGVASNTPSLGVLANGELSLNFADGILYYKSSSNTLGSIRTTAVSGLTTEVQFNDAGSFGANSNFTFNKTIATLNVKNINVSTNLVTANLTATSLTTGTGTGGTIAGANVIYSNIFVANSTTTSISNSTGAIISNGGLGVKGNVYADAIYDGGIEVISFANQAFNQANSANVLAQAAYNQANSALSNTNLNVSGTLRALNQGGDEGGEIFLDRPVTNTSLAAGITIDVYQNKLRIFETGGSVRGVFIDIANSASAGVGTDLLNPTATPDTVARATANAAFAQANSANVLAQAAFNKANTDVTSITTTAGVYGNATHVPVITLSANGRVSSITNTAISGGGTTDFGFGQIFTSNNSAYANASSANDKVIFAGESGIFVYANTITKTVTFAGGIQSLPGANGMTVDYGFVTEAIFYNIDYGTL